MFASRLLSQLLCLLLVVATPFAARSAEPDELKFASTDLVFFEKKIRPVLVEHCYKCHSADAVKSNQLKGGLLVDSRAALLAGGDSGAAVVPGNLEESLLIDALRYESFQMPPKGKLPPHVIADFETWVQRGAADPRQEAAKVAAKKQIDIEAGRKFWCYQPVANPPLPAIAKSTSGGSAIDVFIQAKLEAAQLDFSPPADRATLIRRLYFDLVGLPPSPADIDSFVHDAAPDAYERLVERLLASPRFGERWGRHWLDIARFAESLTLRGFVLPDAWRYRDYVIDTFNADRSFADFVREQVAGDLMAESKLEDRRRNLTATAFLALGNSNLEEQDKGQLRMDVVDEQLETIGKGILAQTIGCARCHDHKFDPIPTRDYYALAGIFRNVKTLEHSNVSKWLDLPLPLEADQEDLFKKQEAEIANLQAKIKPLKDALKVATSGVKINNANDKKDKPTTAPAAISIVQTSSLPGVVVDDTQAKVVGDWTHSTYTKRYVGDGYLQDQNKEKGKKTITFVPEIQKAGKYDVRLSYTTGTNRATDVPVTIFSADGEKVVRINQKETPLIDGLFVSLGQYRFEQNGQGFVLISNEGTNGTVIADAVQFLPVEMLNSTPTVAATTGNAAAKTDSPVSPPAEKPAVVVSLDDQIKVFEKEIKTLTETRPKRPMYLSVKEEAKIDDTQVHVRGSVSNLGEKVPRGFLQVATHGDSQNQNQNLSANESGRRELGDWLVSRDNPLTARVMANRVWHWLIGVGIVRTTDNFGSTGELPSHPELLDHLASRLMDEDWSIKSLVREIVLSRTYRQASEISDFKSQISNLKRWDTVNQPATASNQKSKIKNQKLEDPENRLLSHMNRRRLDGECLLDTMLSVSGDMQAASGGRTYKDNTAADYNYKHNVSLRAIYWPAFRNSTAELLDVFDMADPSTVTGKRNVSTVAPQALYMMNDDWVIARSRNAARTILSNNKLDDPTRVIEAYRRTLGRVPTTAETKLALDYITAPFADEKKMNAEREQRWAQLFQALFASIDFRYVE